jgi:hypothetical protein
MRVFFPFRVGGRVSALRRRVDRTCCRVQAERREARALRESSELAEKISLKTTSERG